MCPSVRDVKPRTITLPSVAETGLKCRWEIFNKMNKNIIKHRYCVCHFLSQRVAHRDP